MARTYTVNGTLALKPCERNEEFQVIDCNSMPAFRSNRNTEPALFDSGLRVADVFDATVGLRMFDSATERVQAFLSGGACVGIFFFLTLISCF